MKNIIIIIVICTFTSMSMHACWTELHNAVFTHNTAKVEAILIDPTLTDNERDALINQQDKFGQTALHIAAQHAPEETLKLLLRFHAKLNIHDRYGYMPIHYIAAAGNITCSQLLLCHGATPNDLSKHHETPLLIAAHNLKFPAAQFFLDWGSDPNIANDNDWTPLHWAAYYEHVEFTIQLLKHDAWIRAKNSDDPASDYANKLLWAKMHLYHQEHMRAHDQMFAFACCLHASPGKNSPARDMIPELMKYIYWLLKQEYYRFIPPTI